MISTAPSIPHFHPGELEIQQKYNVKDTKESAPLRDYMPDQHREFFTTLPFFLVGSREQGNDKVWASVIFGPKGFVKSPNPTTLDIRTRIIAEDPLRRALLSPNANLGFLGIELDTRRRMCFLHLLLITMFSEKHSKETSGIFLNFVNII